VKWTANLTKSDMKVVPVTKGKFLVHFDKPFSKQRINFANNLTGVGASPD